MNSIDTLVQVCVKNPEDHTARRVLSDALRELDQPSTAAAVEDDETGRALMTRLAELARRTGLPPTLFLLWAAYELVPRLHPQPQSPPIPLTHVPLPYFGTPEPDPRPVRPWEVRRVGVTDNTRDDGHEGRLTVLMTEGLAGVNRARLIAASATAG
jgi:hypothetical protein